MTAQLSLVSSFRSARSFKFSLFSALLYCAAPLAAEAQLATPTLLENLSVQPKFGQSQVQQNTDRSECQVWAKSQTGFDPTLTGGGVTANQYPMLRQNYGRAMAACLEGRGYSVQFVAPAAPPAAVPRSYGAPAVVATTPVFVQPAPSTSPALHYRPLSLQIEGGYTVTTSPTSQSLDDGSDVGLGLTWFPASALPIGLRLDGSYSWFHAKEGLLSGGNYSTGHQDIYGGDADLQFNLAHSSSAFQFYLFGGAGWYREQTELRKISYVSGVVCGFFYCGYGYYPAVTAQESSTSDWHHAWNAGFGTEFAIGSRASFFIEARYLRILPNHDQSKFIPINVGLRF